MRLPAIALTGLYRSSASLNSLDSVIRCTCDNASCAIPIDLSDKFTHGHVNHRDVFDRLVAVARSTPPSARHTFRKLTAKLNPRNLARIFPVRRHDAMNEICDSGDLFLQAAGSDGLRKCAV